MCVFLKTIDRERNGQFNGDGSLIAYSAVQSGSEQIYIQPFSPDSPCPVVPLSQLQISKTYSFAPRWGSNGKRLFFEGQDGTMQASEVLAGQMFGFPRILFRGVDVSYGYAVSAGDQFIFAEQPTHSGPPPPFTIVQNWLAGLK